MQQASPEGAEGNSDAAAVDRAISSRRSLRAYLDKPVPKTLVEHILDVSARAPSGTNTQPWRAYAVAGEPRDRLCRALVEAFLSGAPRQHEKYAYYPTPFFEPYLARRRKVGWDLYGLLGIARGEGEKMNAFHARNYEFFGAPVGLIFTIDRRLEPGSWLDHGMFLENVMIAARGHGLDTCPQASFPPFHDIIRQHLPLAPEEMVTCGMSLGYADLTALENQLVTERVPAREFAHFEGFDDNQGGKP